MKTTIYYRSTGHVLGYLWGGGKASYSARALKADTKRELLAKAEIRLMSGSLGSGDFQSLIGALLFVTKVTTKTIKGKDFVNESTFTVFIGDLTKKDQRFLIQSELR